MEFDASRPFDSQLIKDIYSSYLEDGVIILRNLFSDADINNFITKQQSRIDLSKQWANSYLPSRRAFEDDSSITDLLCSEKIMKIFNMLHPPDVKPEIKSEEGYVLHTSEARLGSSNIRWHRDVIVPVEDIPEYIVVSIALSDAEVGSGKIAYIPGSHKWKVDYDQIPPETIKTNSLIGFDYFTKLIEVKGIQPKKFESRKGDVLMWNGYVVHCGEQADDNALRHTLTGHFQVSYRLKFC